MASHLIVSPARDGYRLAYVDELGDGFIEVTTPGGKPLTFASMDTAWDALNAAETEYQRWLASRAEQSALAKQKDAH